MLIPFALSIPAFLACAVLVNSIEKFFASRKRIAARLAEIRDNEY